MTAPDGAETLLDSLARLVPDMQARAAPLDTHAAFPGEDVAALRRLGLLAAPLPRALGGLGLGTEPARAADVLAVLRLLGRGNLSVGRVFEAHVNALRLFVRHGTAEQAERVAHDARDGHLFGLWVTDRPGDPLALRDGRLWGGKSPCSGAGHCTRALLTADDGDGTRMVLAALDGTEEMTPLSDALHGMRASATGAVRFAGTPADTVGRPGDYLREPDFSAGAWRTSAVTLGGMDALLDAARDGLLARGHGGLPLQQERYGLALIARETARLWMERAAELAEAEDAPKGAPADASVGASGDTPETPPVADRVAYVNLARIAVETACLDALRHVQRSLGLAAFVRPNPVERLSRDLGTYLRQPAPDLVLTEAAAHLLARPG